MSASIKKSISLLVVLIKLCLLSACNITPLQQLSPAQLAQQGHFAKAKQNITQNYSKTGNERLLYHLEMASLLQLEKNFEQSNTHLSEALNLIESFYTQSISELAMVQFSGPTYTTYKGKAYYVPQIHTMKAINYNALAKENPTQAQAFWDAALVEMRQLDVFLSELKEKTGGYSSAQTNDSTASKINKVLTPIFAPKGLLENIDYKDDAYAHFLSGVLFEQSGELDSARLQYERAMQMYDNGFEQQYKLPELISQQVSAALIRVMQKSGGYQNKLRELKNRLKGKLESSDNNANVTIVQDIGIAPKRKQLNLLLKADAKAKALVMTPIVFGTTKERKAQVRWFQMLHADTSLFDMVQNYMLGDLGDVAMGTVTKRLPLGPLWDDAVKLGIVDALEFGARISVTYLEPIDTPVKRSEVWLAGKRYTQLLPYHSIGLLTLQDALAQSTNEIRAALTREITKALSAKKVLKEVGVKQDNLLGSLAKLSTSLVNAITASADTRQWQTLPLEIRVAQFALPAGEQQITIKTYLNSGHIIEQSETLNINRNMGLWHTRTFLNTKRDQSSHALSTLNME
ncbi:hypothetical protein HG263_02760 [Pseudoalteromonas sp. JBTF-M23]|uniref:LPP20 lipoprotein n=1 Tax=Pseudoalteromonas caenipelagi TaxID=2726988 RepID=A0A849V981_9GAMM|nr:hypothetical protein [Pseudoalteromonas caenipelagi]NOU49468.1 hypothetical protein [Pseudoalteromonas caenipelagi]